MHVLSFQNGRCGIWDSKCNSIGNQLSKCRISFLPSPTITLWVIIYQHWKTVIVIWTISFLWGYSTQHNISFFFMDWQIAKYLDFITPYVTAQLKMLKRMDLNTISIVYMMNYPILENVMLLKPSSKDRWAQ